VSRGIVHIIGAGLAGLGAAVQLAGAGRQVAIYEAGAHVGGRCRSYHDPQLNRVIDNGNHLVLSGNAAVMRYVRAIGAEAHLIGPDAAEFAFVDLGTRAQWRVRPNASALPWWVMSHKRRVPETKLADYLAMMPLLDRRNIAIGEALAQRGRIWSHFMEPVLLAALNTDPSTGSRRLTANVIRRSLGRGGSATLPRIAHPTLAAAFIDPALALLANKSASVRTGARVQQLHFDDAHVSGFALGNETVTLGPDDQIILAVPPWVAEALVPDIKVPNDFRAIVNAHFAYRLPHGTPPILGIIGGTAQWLFSFEDRCSITVSGADALLDQDRAMLAETFWRDIRRALNFEAPLPAWQIVKERRATFAATPEQERRRPGARTRWRNLMLAGDWTNTGLPATIEGALRSGETAAQTIGI